MKISNLNDPVAVSTITDDIIDALKPLAAKYGLAVSRGPASYTANSLHVKIEIATVSDDGVANTREREDFKLAAGRYGLEPGDLGSTIIISGVSMAIVGLRRKARTHQILCRRTGDGGLTACPAVEVARALGRPGRLATPGATGTDLLRQFANR